MELEAAAPASQSGDHGTLDDGVPELGWVGRCGGVLFFFLLLFITEKRERERESAPRNKPAPRNTFFDSTLDHGALQ